MSHSGQASARYHQLNLTEEQRQVRRLNNHIIILKIEYVKMSINQEGKEMITEIVDNIFIGTWTDALLYHNEYLIFTVAWNSPYRGTYFYELVDCENEPSLETKELFFTAVSDLIKLRAIEYQDRKIMVQCNYGISRSPSVVAGYLIYKYNLKATDALQLIKNTRSIVNPANSFKILLQELEIKYNN
jgi:adenine-specific DNA methylase